MLSAPSSKANLLLPFANITYKYLYSHRGRNSMLSLILSGNHHNRGSFNRNFALPQSIAADFGHAVNAAVCHGDELFHLFTLKFASRKPEDNRDLQVQRLMLSLWTDFAKHGYVQFVFRQSISGNQFLFGGTTQLCAPQCWSRFALLALVYGRQAGDVPNRRPNTGHRAVRRLVDALLDALPACNCLQQCISAHHTEANVGQA